MNLRALLRAQGVSARDLDEAVASAREVTRYAAMGAEMLATGLRHAAPRLKSETARSIAHKGVFLATKIQDGAELMLTHQPRAEAAPPPRAPSPDRKEKKLRAAPRKVDVQIINEKKR